MHKDVRQLVARITDHEDVEVVQGRKHLSVLFKGGLVTTLPTTPSDHRWRENAISELRKAGITLAVRQRSNAVARYREMIPLTEIADRVATIKPRAAFARFVVEDLPTIHPGLRSSTVASVEQTVAKIVHARERGEEPNVREWMHQLLDLGLRAWDRVESQKAKTPERTELEDQGLEPFGLGSVAQLVVADRTTITVTLDVTNLLTALARLGIVIDVK